MEQTRSEKVEKNVIVAYLNKVVILLLTFVSRKIFIEYIGVEYLGINGLFSNILSLLSLADLGFGTAMSYSFYKPLADNDYTKISALIKFYKKIYNFIAMAVSIFGVSLLPFLKYLINIETEINGIHWYYLLFLAQTVISYLFVYKSTLLTADQKNYEVDKISIIVNIGKVVVQILEIMLTRSFTLYLLVFVVSTLINNIILSIKTNKLFPYIKRGGELSKDEKVDIFKNLKAMFLYKISGTLMNSTDNIIISIVVGTGIVGLYSNYNQISANLMPFITILFYSITPAVGNLVVVGSNQEKYKIFKIMQFVSYFLCTLFTVSYLVLVQDFITLWLGSELLLDNITVIAITINIYFSISMQPLWSFREATGMYRKTKYVMLIAAAINVVLSVVLGIFMGIAGVIFASVVSRISTYFWYESKLLFHEYFGISVKGYFLGYLKNILIITFCVIMITYFTKSVPCTIIGFIFKTVVTLGVTSIIYIVINFRQDEFRFLVDKIKKMVNKVSKR